MSASNRQERCTRPACRCLPITFGGYSGISRAAIGVIATRWLKQWRASGRGTCRSKIEYARDTEGDLDAVFVTFSHSYGVKAQKTLAELAVTDPTSQIRTWHGPGSYRFRSQPNTGVGTNRKMDHAALVSIESRFSIVSRAAIPRPLPFRRRPAKAVKEPRARSATKHEPLSWYPKRRPNCRQSLMKVPDAQASS